MKPEGRLPYPPECSTLAVFLENAGVFLIFNILTDFQTVNFCKTVQGFFTFYINIYIFFTFYIDIVFIFHFLY